MSPLLAQSRHELVHRTCPLSGVKRTSLGHRRMSALDPKRTCRPRPASVGTLGTVTWLLQPVIFLCASPSINGRPSRRCYSCPRSGCPHAISFITRINWRHCCRRIRADRVSGGPAAQGACLRATSALTGVYLDRLLYRRPLGRRLGRQEGIRSVDIAGCVRYG
jgi:hypothetical protein